MKLARIFIDRESLSSQITRNFFGDRVFDDLANSFSSNQTSGGGILGFFFDAGKKFLGFIGSGLVGFIGWTIKEAIPYIIEKTIELTNFDWNQSDQEIGNTLSGNNHSIGRQLGNWIGQGAAWLVSLAISSTLTIKFPVFAGRLSLDLARDAGQQLSGGLLSTLMSVGETLVESFALAVYSKSRKLFAPETPTNKDRKPWIISNEINKLTQKIPGSNLVKGLGGGTIDGFLDGILDVAYTISFSLDDHYEAMRESQNIYEEPVRRVEVFPDANSDESVIIEDTQSNVETSIYQYLSTHQLINNRDMGVVVGMPYDDWYTMRPQGRKLVIEFNGKEAPPFIDNDGKRTKRVQVSIPNVKAGIGWNDLKSIRRFTWGGYMARGVFDDRRQMTVWGASQSEAKNTLIDLARLSTQQLLRVSVSHAEIENPRRRKKATVVHPTYAIMLIRKDTVSTNDTILIDEQNKAMSRQRVPIWKDNPPTWFQGFR